MKLYRNDLKGNKTYFELAGSSSYRGKNYRKCMKVLQGKSILVRVSARFELTGGSRLLGVDCSILLIKIY